MTPTKTDKTCLEYVRRAKNITNLYNTAFSRTSIPFAEWLVKFTATKTLRTWTTYRAAIIYSLEQNKVSISNLTNSETIATILNIKGLKTKHKKSSSSTSRLKYKHLPLRIYTELKKELLKESASQYDKILYHWIRATRATGLRPHEWPTLSVKLNNDDGEKKFILNIKNGKFTNDRSFGKYRKIYLQANQEIIRSIMLTWKTLKDNYNESNDDVHERFYKACRDRLLWINSRIGCNGKKKRITIYSARHQFKADMQLKGMDENQIAALMGHGSIATANINYGKKRFARSTETTISPSSKDLDKVLSLNSSRVIKPNPHISNNNLLTINE